MIFNWKDLPPTPRQIFAITRMCIALGIRLPLEELPRNRMEARDLMYDLRSQLLLKRRKVKRVFYHSTSSSSISNIMKVGLLPSYYHGGDIRIRPGVYLATTPFWACMYGGEVLLEVTVPDRSLLKRPRWAQEHERLYYGVVEPSFIKVSKKSCSEVLEEG
mgnify:CR=1 FL=1